MSKALEVLREERMTLARQLDAIDNAIKALSGGSSSGPVKRRTTKGSHMSEETKAKIRASAKARWAKLKKKK